MHVDLRRPPAADVEYLARWWSSATQAQRFALYEQAAREDKPPLAQVRLAAILAEFEAGEVDQGQ